GIREGPVIGSHTLAQINLNSAEEPGDEAHEYGCDGDGAARIADFLCESGDTIETDIGKRGERCGGHNSAGMEGMRVIKRLRREHAAPSSAVEEIAQREHHEGDDYGRHNGK